MKYNGSFHSKKLLGVSPCIGRLLLAFLLFTLQEPSVSANPIHAMPASSVKSESRNDTDSVKCEFRLGTNILYDMGTLANLSLEFGFGRRVAFNVLAIYSPWNIRQDFKLRTLFIQPEVRCYFSKGYRGFYAGVEGHCGWYNMAFGGKQRYQDRDGNTPGWGYGITLGCVLSFSRHWGMDFAIGGGYTHLIYDCFYNIENGAKFTTKTLDWWGPTKAAISFYYQF